MSNTLTLMTALSKRRKSYVKAITVAFHRFKTFFDCSDLFFPSPRNVCRALCAAALQTVTHLLHDSRCLSVFLLPV